MLLLVPRTLMSPWTKIHPNQNKLLNLSILVYIISLFICVSSSDINSDGVEPPTPCESCSLFVRELNSKISRIHTKSESDFLDVIQDFCEIMLTFKVHKDKEGISRFAKEESETMKTLKQLRNRGVKVELGMPAEMWDAVGAESQLLKQQCELILSEYEDDLVDWFLAGKISRLEDLLCRQRYLRNRKAADSCLSSNPSYHEL